MGPGPHGSPTSAVSWIGNILLRQCKMPRLLPSNLLLLVAALLVLLLLVVPSTGEHKPGHMQHQYYKDQEVARRQRASRKAEWGEYAHHSGAAERENMLVVVLLAAVHLAYNHLV